jgi:hypothetical protein
MWSQHQGQAASHHSNGSQRLHCAHQPQKHQIPAGAGSSASQLLLVPTLWNLTSTPPMCSTLKSTNVVFIHIYIYNVYIVCSFFSLYLQVFSVILTAECWLKCPWTSTSSGSAAPTKNLLSGLTHVNLSHLTWWIVLCKSSALKLGGEHICTNCFFAWCISLVHIHVYANFSTLNYMIIQYIILHLHSMVHPR